MAGSSKAGSLLIDVAADVGKLRKDFNDASGIVKGFGRDIEAMGRLFKTAMAGLAVGAVVHQVLALVDAVGALGEAAETVGLSTRDFQAFTAALTQAGVEGSQAQALLAKGAKFLGGAMEGNKENIERLKELGINLIDAKGNAASYSDSLQRMAEAVLKIDDPFKQAAASLAFFGKSGQAALPGLQAMAQGADKLAAQFDRQIIPDSTIKRFDEFSDAILRLRDVVRSDIAKGLDGLADEWIVKRIIELRDALLDMSDVLSRLAKSDFGVVLKAGFVLLVAPIQFIAELVKDFGEYLLRLPVRLAPVVGSIKEMWAGLVREVEIAKGILTFDSDALEKASKDYAEAITRIRQETTAMQTAAVNAGGFFPMPPITVTATNPNKPTGLPGIKNPGVDKFAEAMARLKAETEATQAAIDTLAKSNAFPTKEAERFAKLQQDIGLKTSSLLKDIPDLGKKKEIEEAVRALEELKFKLEDWKVTAATADEVNGKFGDGQKDLADRVYYLDKAFAAGKIGLLEYNAALEQAQITAEKQQAINEGLKGGIEGLGAGFKFAALQMSQTQIEFQLGQQLFTDSFRLMSNAISEFVKTGELDFGKLAASFAEMLTNMALQWAAQSLLREFMGGGGGLAPGQYGPPNPNAGIGGMIKSVFGLFAGGMLASGGDVVPGRVYTVGEAGPETFVPTMAGRIVPNAANSNDVTVNVAMGGGGGSGDAKTTVEFARRIKTAVVDVITNEQRPGGLLYARGA